MIMAKPTKPMHRRDEEVERPPACAEDEKLFLCVVHVYGCGCLPSFTSSLVRHAVFVLPFGHLFILPFRLLFFRQLGAVFFLFIFWLGHCSPLRL
jgi:hypothetical protein